MTGTQPSGTATRSLKMRILMRCMAMIYAGILVAGLCILVWPDAAAVPLIKRGEWLQTSGFHTGDSPNAREVRSDILQSPELICWRSWSPATLSTTGRLESVPFMAPHFIAIPIGGFPCEMPGLEIFLQKVNSDERLLVANARMNTQWSQVDLHIPQNFRTTPVQLVATSASTEKYVSVGTPFKISRISYLKSQTPALLALHAIGIAYCMLLVLLCLFLVRRFVPAIYVFPVSLGGACLLGYLAFFIFHLNATAGKALSAIIMTAGLFALWRTRRLISGDQDTHGIRDYLFIWFLASAFHVLALYLCDTGAGSWHANARYTPVRWSTDNQIPFLVAENIFNGKPLQGLLSPWKVSDRPPLQSGLMALARLPLEPLFSTGKLNSIIQYYHHILGIIANSLWAPALLFGLRIMGIRRSRAIACTLVAAFLPFTIFNSIYIWPKMLGGALGLLAFAVLYDGRQTMQSSSLRLNSPFYIAAMLAALSLMSHSGAAMGLVIIALWPVAVRYLPSPKHLVLVVIVGMAILSPWIIWQKQADPPGNVLMKSALAGGRFRFDEPDVSLLQTMKEEYSKHTFRTWLTVKKDSVAMLLGDPTNLPEHGLGDIFRFPDCDIHNLPTRVLGFFLFFPSLGMLPLALIAFIITPGNWSRFKHLAPDLPKGVYPSITVAILSFVLSILIMWPFPIVHQLPYQAIFLTVLALLILLASSSSWLAIATGLAILTHGLLVWILPSAFLAARFHYHALGMLIFFMAWSIAWIIRTTMENKSTVVQTLTPPNSNTQSGTDGNKPGGDTRNATSSRKFASNTLRSSAEAFGGYPGSR